MPRRDSALSATRHERKQHCLPVMFIVTVSGLSLPLAARRPQLVFPDRLEALTVQRAQF